MDSDDSDYVMRRIRENHITGSSCTIVLCGAETHLRKYVDWEIKATLDKEHAVIGVELPSIQKIENGQVYVPERFADNIRSGYARFIHWNDIYTTGLQVLVNNAVNQKTTWKIDNKRSMMKKNKSNFYIGDKRLNAYN